MLFYVSGLKQFKEKRMFRVSVFSSLRVFFLKNIKMTTPLHKDSAFYCELWFLKSGTLLASNGLGNRSQ